MGRIDGVGQRRVLHIVNEYMKERDQIKLLTQKKNNIIHRIVNVNEGGQVKDPQRTAKIIIQTLFKEVNFEEKEY